MRIRRERWRIFVGDKHLAGLTLSLVIVALLLATASSTLAHDPPVNVSGYETFFGRRCKIGGQRATCGVTFTGWIGGDGLVPEGWETFPGDFEGIWKARISYTAKAGFGKTVDIVAGNWRIAFIDGHTLKGEIISGTVQWPVSESSNLGCGDGVGVVNASLSVEDGGAGTFAGCLHDLPAGDVIPPKVWGTFSTP